MNFLQSIKSVYKNYWNYKGRASRSEYWYYILFSFLVGIFFRISKFFLINIAPNYVAAICGTNQAMALINLQILSTLFNILSFIPGLFVSIRRLHDTNSSGWFIFINLIPIAGLIIYIVSLCSKSDEGNNDYGPNLLQTQPEQPQVASN